MNHRLGSYLKRAWANLPEPMRDVTATIEWKIACVPRTYYDPLVHGKRLARGVVAVSFDFELAWGWQYEADRNCDFVAMGLWERAQIPSILEALECYSVPATWFTVGHLFLDGCARGSNGHAHSDVLRLVPGSYERYEFEAGDWFQNDPCTDVRRDPAWYAPDLVEMILSSPLGHEVACHTFSHAYFGPKCPSTVAASELNASIEAMGRLSVRPQSFCFPRGAEGNFDAIAGAGFRIVRAFTGRHAILSLPIRRADALWTVHASTAIDRGARWSIEQRLARLKGFADAAASEKLAFHLFLHPSLSTDERVGILVPFLAYCAKKREQGVLDVVGVGELVSRVQNNETSIPV